MGAFSGLIFVYSADLPQIEQLEHYRPISSTELYDVHGKIIGSFALQRRVVATYNDFPPVLINALVSTENKHFFRPGVVNIWPVRSLKRPGTVALTTMLYGGPTTKS